jgi:hypothetical protein
MPARGRCAIKRDDVTIGEAAMATSSFPALGNDEEGAQDARFGPWPKQRLVDSKLEA